MAVCIRTIPAMQIERSGSFSTGKFKLGLVSVTSVRDTQEGQYDPLVQLPERHTLWNKEANTQPLSVVQAV